MAQKILLKRSNTTGNYPTNTQIDIGELAINTYDGSMFMKLNDGSNSVIALHHNQALHYDTSNDRVGIGTTSPSELLHVYGNLRVGTTAQGRIKFADSDVTQILGRDGTHGSGASMTFTVNSGDRLHIDSSGNVGIGTTSPNCALHVNGQQLRITNGAPILTLQDSTDDDDHTIRFQDNGGTTRYSITSAGDNFNFITNGTREITFQPNNSEAMRIDSSGNVGIGTTSPDAQLEVENSSGTGRIAISGTTGANLQFRPNTSYTAGGNFGIYTSGLTSGTYESTMTIKGYGSGVNDVMTIKGLGSVGIGETSPVHRVEAKGTDAAMIAHYYGQSRGGFAAISGQRVAFLSTSINDDLVFGRAGNPVASSGFVERMRIDNGTGNVGINDTVPSKGKLQINQQSNTLSAIQLTNSSQTSSNFATYPISIFFGDEQVGSAARHQASINAVREAWSGSPAGLTFKTSASVNGATEKMRITSAGNVGIGTSNPSGRLHVYDSGTDTYGTQPIAIFDYYDTDDTALRYSARIGDGATTFKTFVTSNATDFLIQDQDNQAGRLAFQVTGNAGSNQILAAESTGKVGIGTITPDENLHIYDTGNADLKIERASGAVVFGQAQASAGVLGTSSNHRLDLKSNGSTRLSIANTGAITFNTAYTFPTSDGSANQVLQTDGSGNLSFATVSGGGGVTISNNANNRVLTGDGTNANAEANLTFDGSTLDVTGNVIIDTNPAATYGVSEALRIDDVGNTTDRQLQFFELLHSGARSHRLAFNTNITSTGSAYTYTQGNYGGSSAIHFGNSGEVVFYVNGQVTSGSTDAITPTERFRVHSDGKVKITGSGTIGGNTPANGYLQITDGSNTLAFDNNEIHTTDNLYLNAEDGIIYLRGNDSGAVTLKNGAITFMDTTRNLSNIGTISSGAITSSGHIQAAGALKVTETGTAQVIMIGNQDSSGVNKPAMIMGVNGYLRFGHGNSWSSEGGTFTETLSLASGNATFSGNIDVNSDSGQLQFGADNDMQIFHNGANGEINNATGDFTIDSAGDIILDGDGADIILKDGGTEFGRFTQLIGGLAIGAGSPGGSYPMLLSSNKVLVFTDMQLGDDEKIIIGDGATGNLQIFHDGTNSYLDDVAEGDLILRTNGTNVKMMSGSETMVNAAKDGAVTLYYDNSAKLATKSDGVDITGELQSDSLDVDGNAEISGNLVLSGNLTVNGSTVTNSATNTTIEDALIELGSGNTGANANDLGLILERGTTGNNIFIGWDESEDKVAFGTTTATGSSSGSISYSRADILASSLDLANHIDIADSGKIRLGNSDDLQLYHDGSHSFIRDVGTGSLYIDTGSLIVRNVNNNANMIVANASGAVTLYNDGSSRLTTSSTGIQVDGPNGNVTIGAQNTTGLHIYTDRDRFYFNKITSHISNSITSYSGDFNLQRQESTKLTLTSTGASVTGNLAVTGTVDGRDIATDGSKLDGIEANATADQTASEILTAIKTVDGSGSGLDADLLDGINSGSFLRSDAADSFTGTLTGGTGANILLDSNVGDNGTTAFASMTGRLEFDHDYSDTVRGPNKIVTYEDGSWIAGLGIHSNTAAYYSGHTHAWYKTNSTTSFTQNMALNSTGSLSTLAQGTVWGASNDGSGSGLDADTLDGVQGSSYLRSDASDTYTGTLTLGTNTSIRLPDSSAYGIHSSTGHRVIDSSSSTLRIGDTAKHNIIRLHGQGSDDFRVYYGSTDYQIFHAGNPTQITQVGTITSGTWNGGVIASAYLDSDTAHLSGTQTFSGAKTFSAGINMNNSNISGVNAIQMADPGPNEGVSWSNIKIYESPNDLSSNSAGNFQVVYGSTRRLTVSNTGVDVNGALTATTKSFDIEHPSKDGMRLRYGSLEGPENGVYVRGKSQEKVILLPDYWVDLVHEDSITVQLTAIGGGQELYVEKIEDNKVYVNGENYFYYIQAERKDVERFEVEYGNSI